LSRYNHATDNGLTETGNAYLAFEAGQLYDSCFTAAFSNELPVASCLLPHYLAKFSYNFTTSILKQIKSYCLCRLVRVNVYHAFADKSTVCFVQLE